MDDLDRALVHALQVDGRAPFRRLSEVLGVSDQTVARRYDRLCRSRALRVVGLSNESAVNQVAWIVRLRAMPQTAEVIAAALARRSDTSWVDVCSGGIEVVSAATIGAGVASPLLEVLLRNRDVLDVRADQVLHIFRGASQEAFTKHGPLEALQVAQLAEHLPVPIAAPRVDITDRRILDVLRGDGRASIEQLRAATELSEGGVRRRLHALRAGGVLQLTVDVDLGLLEFPIRTVLWLNVGPGALDAVGKALATHSEVAFAAATTGPANVFATVLTRDAAAFYHYLTTTVAVIPDVGLIDISPITRQVKAAVADYGLRRTRDTATSQRT